MIRLYTHASCLAHEPGHGHPECPARLGTVLDALDHDRFATLDRVEAPLATRTQLERVHDPAYIDRLLEAIPEEGTHRLDEDTLISPRSVEAAMHAAGAVCAAVDDVMGHRATRAFCAVRPPGHHATRDRAMGFCLFNSVAVGAAHALAKHRLKRVAIVDFDVHHGNGSQDIYADDTRVMYVSSHQAPLYPWTGDPEQRGAGNIRNGILAEGAGSQAFRELWEHELLPELFAFKPQLVLISAGFDAHRLDPLAQVNLETEDYAWITGRLVQLAHAHASGRIVSTLEGGYDLNALRAGVSTHLQELMLG